MKDQRVPFSKGQILQLHSVACSLGIEQLQNAVMTLFYQKTMQEFVAPTTEVNIIYNMTLEGAPIRRFIVDYNASFWDFDLDKPKHAKLPKEFLVDLLKELKAMKKAPGVGHNKVKWTEQMNKDFCRKYPTHSEEAEVA